MGGTHNHNTRQSQKHLPKPQTKHTHNQTNNNQIQHTTKQTIPPNTIIPKPTHTTLGTKQPSSIPMQQSIQKHSTSMQLHHRHRHTRNRRHTNHRLPQPNVPTTRRIPNPYNMGRYEQPNLGQQGQPRRRILRNQYR